MQNRSYGKLAQTKMGFQIEIDNVEEAVKYLQEGYDIMRSEGYNYFYQKEKTDKVKPFYAPIIPTLINAQARIIMYEHFKKIGKENLIYTDTDSCIMKGGTTMDVPLGENLGEFKIVEQSKPLILHGKKTYAIGEEIKIAGFRKRDITFEDFKKGEITSKRMITMKTCGSWLGNNIGSG